ncbi:hypothetical protein [Erythrobacter rubeus]|uniref:DUF4440 domain-containing protein n=1 Tax=Erythrobacter rubeus TaxID=2760803 RepID=A0ABR8KW18_9SPHN|nr:hypothetical protein [Erythrobacter rubeus]MBD2842614.1 hypothetical protein [Erythrobacter rubeus]
MQNTRRSFMVVSSVAAGSAMAPVSAVAQNRSSGSSDAAKAFLAAHQGTFEAGRRLGFLLPDGLAVTNDVPFPMDYSAYQDHLNFHAENWDLHEWMSQDIEIVELADGSAVVSAFYIERGKPRDAGFRLRPGFATATCVMHEGEWKALSVHFSSLRSQVLDASPS